MVKCATTFGNLIEIPHFSNFTLFLRLFFLVTAFTADISASSETMLQILRAFPPAVAAIYQVHLKVLLKWYHDPFLFLFSEAVCTRLPAYIVNFPSCTLNDAFYLSCPSCFGSPSEVDGLFFIFCHLVADMSICISNNKNFVF